MSVKPADILSKDRSKQRHSDLVGLSVGSEQEERYLTTCGHKHSASDNWKKNIKQIIHSLKSFCNVRLM